MSTAFIFCCSFKNTIVVMHCNTDKNTTVIYCYEYYCYYYCYNHYYYYYSLLTRIRKYI